MKIITTSCALLFISMLKADIIFFENFDDGMWPDEWENEVYTDPTSGDTILATNETNWRIGIDFQSIDEGHTPPAALFLWMPRVPIPAADLDTWYELSMTTPEINVQNIDSVLIEFDISLDFYAPSQYTNGLTIEVGNGENWSELMSYEVGPEQGFEEIPFHTESFIVETVSEFIKIRWKAYGNDSYYIDSWIIDNIKVSSFLTEPDILINEFLAGSDTCCGADIFDGNTEDFVELYNSGPDSININGWGFSDTDGLITTLAPDTNIAPGEFLVLWYTGDNNGFPEINEKLSKDGETIYIADEVGNTIISYDFGPQSDDISYGRNPDGSENWEYFLAPTPGESNVIENSPPGPFSLISPLSDMLQVNLYNQDDSTVFSWAESLDPDGEIIQYSFQFYGYSHTSDDGFPIFTMFYENILIDTVLSLSNYSIANILIDHYPNSQNIGSFPLIWGVIAFDEIDSSGNIYLGNHHPGETGCYTNLSFSGDAIGATEIVINEFLAGSENCCGADLFSGNSEDFVELFNYGTDPVNIYGWGFSNSDGSVTTVASETSIAPGGFFVLWYTGDNNDFPQVDKNLALEGDTISIVNMFGDQLINYGFGAQANDVSYGRSPDGSETWEYFTIPTPGEANIQSLELDNQITPKRFTVFSPYPNPFNPVTTISYQIPDDGFVNVSIYDMRGRVVKTLVNSQQSHGNKFFSWNATDNRNRLVPAGVYLYKIEFGDFVSTRKMILLK